MSEDDRLVREKCSRDPEHDLGRERCSLVLRNAGGSKATRDEYLRVTNRSVHRFAVYPRDEEIDWTRPPE